VPSNDHGVDRLTTIGRLQGFQNASRATFMEMARLPPSMLPAGPIEPAQSIIVVDGHGCVLGGDAQKTNVDRTANSGTRVPSTISSQTLTGTPRACQWDRMRSASPSAFGCESR
jgi:hypothetical protein